MSSSGWFGPSVSSWSFGPEPETSTTAGNGPGPAGSVSVPFSGGDPTPTAICRTPAATLAGGGSASALPSVRRCGPGAQPGRCTPLPPRSARRRPQRPSREPLEGRLPGSAEHRTDLPPAMAGGTGAVNRGLQRLVRGDGPLPGRRIASSGELVSSLT